MIEGLSIGHVGLNVTNLDTAERFFQNALGFTTLERSAFNESPFSLMGQGGKLSVTLWQQSAGAFSANVPGLHHLAFLVSDQEKLAQVRQQLEENGARFLYEGTVAQSEGSDSSAIYFEGPDGIRLEVCAPNGGAGLAPPTPGAPACGFF